MIRSARDIAMAARIFGDYTANRLVLSQRKRRDRRRPGIAADNAFPNLGIVFIHVPKAAGSSIQSFLASADRTAGAANSARWSVPPETMTIGKHAKSPEVRAAFGPDTYDSWVSFAVVRNPWDLMVSSYFWWRQHGVRLQATMYEASIVRSMAFDDFIRSRYGRHFINEWHGEMWEWFRADGRDLVDVVGRAEELPDVLSEVAGRAGFSLDTSALPRINTTRRSDYRSYYTDAARDLVGERFAYEIDRFQYRF